MATLIKNVVHEEKKVDVLIEGNKISKIAETIEPPENATIIDGTNKVILPAFYNTHTHSPMTVLKGLGEDKNLQDWLQTQIWPREAKLTKDDIYYSAKFAILEMIKSGTVFMNDMYKDHDQVVKAVDEMGIRAAVSFLCMDFFNPEITKKTAEELDKYLQEKFPNDNRVLKAISVHAVYTVSDELMDLSAKKAKEYNLPLHIHACETEFEVNECNKKHGFGPLQKLEKHGLLTDKTILAHCVHLKDEDIELIKKYNCKIGHCPVSNLKLNSGNLKFKKLLDNGVILTLGTDGSSSNNSLSMIEEMKVCALNAKNEGGSPETGKTTDVFKIATQNGAEAFGIDAGVIQEGKLADFILVDLNNYHMLPNNNLIANMVYSADNSVITDVFCDGKCLMRNGHVEGEEKIMEDFKKVAEKVKNY